MKQLRKKQGWTQADLADETEMSKSAISNIEIGNRRPSVEAAQRIGSVLGFDWTLFFESNPSK